LSIHHRNRILLLCLVTGIFIFSGCNTTKYIGNDELLLNKNTIKITTNAKKRETGSLDWQLSTLYKQKPNKKAFGLGKTRLWWYYKAQKHIRNSVEINPDTQLEERDTSRLYKFILRRIAERPAFYDLDRTDATAQSMIYYLNNRGFYNADVKTEIVTNSKKKLVQVIYHVQTDSLMRIDASYFGSEDTNIAPYLLQIQKGTLLNTNTPLDSRTFSKEKTRITRILKDEGFCYFFPSYIIYEGDSSGLNTDVTTIIVPPTDSTFHKKYHIKDVFIHTQYQPSANIRTQYDTTIYKGFHFIKKAGEPFDLIKEKLIDAIYFKKGGLYSLDNHDKTSKRIGKLNVYKFVSLKILPTASTADTNWINYNIYLTPSKKMDLSANGSVNYITGDGTIGEALGLFVNGTYRNKNLFRGGQQLSLSAGYGIESPLSATTLIDFANSFTQDIRVQADLRFAPFSNNANLRVSSGYNLVQRFQQYNYNLFNTELGIDWTNSVNKSFTLNPLSINYLAPTIDPIFQPRLDENPLLARSFDPQLVVGGNYAMTISGKNDLTETSWAVRGNADFSGNFLYLLDQLIAPDEPFVFGGDSITYSQYSLAELDFRLFGKINRDVTFAWRINSGIGYPYANSKDAGLPYVKQFFAGGNSGIRAWRVRQLGPGGAPNDFPADSALASVTPFQTGDFKFETNFEGRFDLGSIFAGLEGAAFVDLGNVWSLTDDSDNGVKLLAANNFFKRIAIGAGIGIRYDFSFFILRIDYAWRIRRTYSATGDDDDLSQYWEFRHAPMRLNNGRVNLAIGYPF